MTKYLIENILRTLRDDDYNATVSAIRECFSIDDLFDTRDIEDYIKNNFSPEDLFGYNDLYEWAIKEGFRENSESENL